MKNLTFKAAMLNDSRTTVNRQSTDGQSQRHCKQTPLSKRWKVLMTLVFLFTFAIGNVWGEDFTINPANSSNLSPGNIVKVTLGDNLKIGSGQIQTNNKSLTGTFTISTTAPGLYLKSANFTDKNSGKIESFTCTSGGTLEGLEFTASTNATTATFSLVANSKGAAKLGDIAIVVTNGTTNNIVTLSSFSKSESTITASSVKCNGSTVDAPIAITSSSWTISSGKISAPSSDNSKTVTISANSGYTLKYVAFDDGTKCQLFITETSTTGGTCDGASWTAANNTTTSVTFKNGVGAQLTIDKIYVIAESLPKHHVTYALGGDYGTTPTQADVAEGAKFTLHNGTTGITAPSGMQFAGWSDGTTTYAGEAEYTMGTDDVELTAQWETVKTNPTATFSAGAYVVGASALDLSGLWSSNSDGTVTYALKEASENATVSGSSFTATKAGSYVVVASQTATSTYNAIEKEATITVTWPATGDADVLFNIATGTSNEALGTASKEAHSASINTLSDFAAYGGLTVSGLGAGKSGLSTKLQTLSEKDANKYIYVTFNVANGYIFTINSVTTKVVAVTSPKTIEVALSDANNNEALSYTQSNNSSAASHEFEFAGKAYEGTVTLKIYAYGATDHYRLAAPLTVSGTVAVKPSPVAPSFTAPTEDQSAEYTVGATIAPLEVTASGYPAPTYQWYKNTTATATIDNDHIISGATNASYTPANNEASGFYYYCVATNSVSSTTSPFFHVVVNLCNKPGTPDNLVASNESYTTADFAWDAAANAAGYKVSILKKSDESVVLDWTDCTTNAYAATGLAQGTKYIFKVKAIGETGYCEFGDEAAVTFETTVHTVAELVKIDDDYTFTPTVTIDAGTLTADSKFFASGSNACDMSNGKMRVKENRALAFNVNSGAKVKVTFTEKSDDNVPREMQLGTAMTGDANKVYGHSGSNPATFTVTADGVVYLTASKDLYFTQLEIMYPHSVSYALNGGTADPVLTQTAKYVGEKFTVHDGVTGITAPTGMEFDKWKDQDNADVAASAEYTMPAKAVTLTAQWKAEAIKYAVTFNFNGQSGSIEPQNIKHGEKATKPADPVVIGQEFGGWYTEVACENAFDFNTTITEAKELFAKWTAFTGCVELWPAKTGENPAVDDVIAMQDGSNGATMTVLNLGDGSLSYTNAGLAFASNSGPKVGVVLGNEMKVGTQIQLILVAGGTKTRGLNLHKANGDKINDFTCWVDGVNPAVNGAEDTFTYTVVAGDGLEGTNEFQLSRNNTVYLKALKIKNCGDAIIYHDLTSEVNIAGKGTVTLGANTVREGYTTTATYSDIDPLYEFVSWEVSGTGASIEDASANPATITMGTEDAVVTLNLKVKPVMFTVNYYDGTTLLGTEEVNTTEHPTATGIETAKAHYIFEGWAESATATASDVIDLNTITSDVAAIFDLYAIYSEFPCPVSGNVFSMTVTDPEDTEYLENNAFGVEIGATYVGGKAYSGSKSDTKRKGAINSDGEYSFGANGDVAVKIEMDCALQAGDVISFTNSNTRQLIIQKVVGTNLYTTVNKSYTIPANSPLIGEYEFYLMRDNSGSTFKTFTVYRPAKVTGVSLENATVAIGNTVTPTMTLLPSNEAYYESIAWSIVGEGEGTIANINAETGAVTALAAGTVTVQVKLNNSESLKATCQVEVVASFEQVDVTESTVWEWTNAAATQVSLTDNTKPKKGEEGLMANIAGVYNNASFNSQALLFRGEHVRKLASGIYYCTIQSIKFNVTVPGAVLVTFESNGSNARTISINDKKCSRTTSGTDADDYITYALAVEPGLVEIKGLEGTSNTYVRISKIEFKATAEYTRPVNPAYLGTLCWKNNAILGGATLFEFAGKNENNYLVFDEVEENRLEAGKPYIFMPEDGNTEIKVYNIDDAAALTQDQDSVNHMYGTIVGKTLNHIDDADMYYFSSNHIWRVGDFSDDITVPAYYCYIDYPAVLAAEPAPTTPAPGRRRVTMGVQGSQIATGMGEIEASETPMKVMIDGQMFIIRGEKMFDVTGKLVK